MTNQAPSSCEQFSIQASKVDINDQPSEAFGETMRNTRKNTMAGAFKEEQNEAKSDNYEHMLTKKISLSQLQNDMAIMQESFRRESSHQ